jgi:hypothetical protein
VGWEVLKSDCILGLSRRSREKEETKGECVPGSMCNGNCSGVKGNTVTKPVHLLRTADRAFL